MSDRVVSGRNRPVPPSHNPHCPPSVSPEPGVTRRNFAYPQGAADTVDTEWAQPSPIMVMVIFRNEEVGLFSFFTFFFISSFPAFPFFSGIVLLYVVQQIMVPTKPLRPGTA